MTLTQLKTYIRGKIYKNNTKAIKGDVLQEVLIEMVDTIPDNIEIPEINTSDFATAAQGAKADSAAQSAVIGEESFRTVTLPISAERQTCQIFNGKLYMPQHMGTTLEIFDLTSETIRTVTLPTDMWRLTCQIFNGKLYMPEGGNPNLFTNTLEIFDLTTETTHIEYLPTNMSRHTSQIFNGSLYLLSNNNTTLDIFSISIPVPKDGNVFRLPHLKLGYGLAISNDGELYVTI